MCLTPLMLFFFGAFVAKHCLYINLCYPARPPANSVAIYWLSIFVCSLWLPAVLILALFEETTMIIDLKNDILFSTIAFGLGFIWFLVLPSWNPFVCSECTAEMQQGAAPRLSSQANPKIINHPPPPHRGDRTCVMCLDHEAVPATVFECGHDVTCRDCFHQFMAYGHLQCPRCHARRVY